MRNFVIANRTSTSAGYVPEVSFTVNTGPVNETWQVGDPEAGPVTMQVLASPAVVDNATPEPDSVMTSPAFAPAVIAVLGVKAIVAVVEVALTLEESVIAKPRSHDMAGKEPEFVLSSKKGALIDMSLEVPAATLVIAGIPWIGVENFETTNAMGEAAANVPDVNLMANTLVPAAEHVALTGCTNEQTLSLLKPATPTPQSVMMMPAFAPAVIAVVGVNVNVAVVTEAFAVDARVTWRPTNVLVGTAALVNMAGASRLLESAESTLDDNLKPPGVPA